MSNFHFDLSLKLPQGGAYDFSGEVQKFSGEVQNDLRGDAHLSTPPLKIWLWKVDLQCTELCQCENMESTELIVILISKTKGMECCARVSSRSWGETSTQRAAIKETMLPRIF
jgi:hypothetical protein